MFIRVQLSPPPRVWCRLPRERMAVARGDRVLEVPPRERLLPDNSVTRVCCVVGDADPYAPHAALAAALAKYPPRSPAEGVHVVQGMEHEVTETSVAKGLAFLSSLLRDTAPI